MQNSVAILIAVLVAPGFSTGSLQAAAPRSVGDIAAPIVYKDLMLVLVNSDGVGAVVFGEPIQEGVKYRFRYESKDGKRTDSGEGKVFEARDARGDLTGELFLKAGSVKVGWSRNGETAGWVYYNPKHTRVHIAKAKRFADSEEVIPFSGEIRPIPKLDLQNFLHPTTPDAEHGADLPDLSIKAIVDSYLKQAVALKSIQAKYSVIQHDVRPVGNNAQGVQRKGVFAMADGKMAARTHNQHAVFDGKATTFRGPGGELLKTPQPASLFSQHWDHPALLFHRMLVPNLDPVAEILRDAAGSQAFGKINRLEKRLCNGKPCYVIDGTYDRAKYHKLERREPIPWRYRVFMRPGEVMQLVRIEAFDLTANIPVGAIDITKTVRRGDVPIPVSGGFHWREGKVLKSERVYENLIQLDLSTLKVNKDIDGKLFRIAQPGETPVDPLRPELTTK